MAGDGDGDGDGERGGENSLLKWSLGELQMGRRRHDDELYLWDV
jgi:hypothetical protein